MIVRLAWPGVPLTPWPYIILTRRDRVGSGAWSSIIAGGVSLAPSRISRRQFAIGSAGLVALGTLGCDGSSPQDSKAKGTSIVKPPTEPFTVGPVDGFLAPGVYDEFSETRRVWLVSDGSVLVALANLCTHKGCGLDWSDAADQFQCPCHFSKFGRDGINLPKSKARRPLERWAIDQVRTTDGPLVRIDPTRSFRKDRDEWSDPATTLKLT